MLDIRASVALNDKKMKKKPNFCATENGHKAIGINNINIFLRKT